MHIHLDFILPWWAFALLALWLVWRLYVGTWVHYLAIFHIKKVEDDLKARGQRLGPMSRFFGYWVLLPKGLLLDWLLNIVVSLPFWDLPASPRELVTGRLQRYVDGPHTWRRRVALALDADKLEPYDNGHIRKQ